MRWRFILSLIFLATGLTLLELRSGAQTPVPTAAATGSSVDISSILNQIAGAGLGAVSGLGGASGTSGTSGTAGATTTPTPGIAQVAPIVAPITPLPDRASTDTPGERVQATLNGMRTQKQQMDTRISESGTVMPGTGLSNRNAALAAAQPPRHTVESVLAGNESVGQFLAYNAFQTAVNQTVTDVATVVAASNPFDALFNTTRSTLLQPTVTATTPPASQPAATQASAAAKGYTGIPTRKKLRVTADQLFDAESFQDYTDDLLQGALDTITSVPGQGTSK